MRTTSIDHSLLNLGYTPSLAAELAARPGDTIPARVLRVDGPRVLVITADGEREATLPGRVRADPTQAPVIGDWVAVGPQPGDDQALAIVARLTRKSRLARVAAGTTAAIQIIAANVDRVFIVMGLDGDFNLRRLERYLTLCADAGVEAVVLLTKAGACADVEPRLAASRAIAPPGVALGVHAVDVIDGIAAELPRQYTGTGVTIALVGSSGAGKSTLVNHLLGCERMATSDVRRGDDRGRHTTTHRQLVILPGGGVLIDNPGMRELSLWIEGDGLERVFSDVDRLAQSCRFGDCSHDREPGCAIRQAIADGVISEARVASHRRLLVEVETTERRRDKRQQRADGRRRSKLYRQTKADSRRRKGG